MPVAEGVANVVQTVCNSSHHATGNQTLSTTDFNSRDYGVVIPKAFINALGLVFVVTSGEFIKNLCYNYEDMTSYQVKVHTLAVIGLSCAFLAASMAADETIKKYKTSETTEYNHKNDQLISAATTVFNGITGALGSVAMKKSLRSYCWNYK